MGLRLRYLALLAAMMAPQFLQAEVMPLKLTRAYEKSVSPIRWAPSPCHRRFAFEPKDLIRVYNTKSGKVEILKIYSDLCAYTTAQWITEVFETRNGVIIGISGYGTDENIVFSGFVVK